MKTTLRFSYYRVEFYNFEAIRKHSISPAPRKIRGRPPRKSGVGGHRVGTQYSNEVRGRRAPGEIIDFSFYLHRGRSAEDPRKIRGRPPRKTPAEGHRGATRWPQVAS